MEKYDIIVIGGGPSGLMAAVSAAEQKASVLLVDKGDKLGRKLAISGGGRCNVTNRKPVQELVKYIPGNGRFLYSAFTNFDNEAIIRFFEGLGIELKEEDKGRMFPVSDSAKTVVSALIGRARDLGVTMKTNEPVQAVLYGASGAEGIKLKNGRKIAAGAVIVAVGGMSVPKTGSEGDGYAWAKAAGHTITELYPTEVPVVSHAGFIKSKRLQGLSLQDAALTVISHKGKALVTHRWDMLFTHFGLSGPAVLRCSQYIVKALKKAGNEPVYIQIDSLPDQNEEELYQQLTKMAKAEPKKSIKNVWRGLVPERYLLFLLEEAGVSPEVNFHQLRTDKTRAFARLLKGFKVKADGTLSIEKAFITGGGVSLKEVNPKTLASKLMPGLYFCGEILDIHGYTGGYNITAAFATGYSAGMNAGSTVI